MWNAVEFHSQLAGLIIVYTTFGVIGSVSTLFCSIFDVEGQKVKRRKWIQYFSGKVVYHSCFCIPFYH